MAAPSQHAPAIAVIGLPDLPAALRSCGYECLADANGDTSTSAVAAATRKAAADGRPYVVIVAGRDPSLRSWVAVQVAQGRPVLIATSEHLPFGDPIAKTRSIPLPATVDEIMAVFGAPPAGGAAGNATVLSDGRVFAEPPRDPDGDPRPTPADDDPFASSLFANPAPVDDPFIVEPGVGGSPVPADHTGQPLSTPDRLPANPFASQGAEIPAGETFRGLHHPADTTAEPSQLPSTSTSPLDEEPRPIDLPMRPPLTHTPPSPFRLEAEVVPPPPPPSEHLSAHLLGPPTDPVPTPLPDPSGGHFTVPPAQTASAPPLPPPAPTIGVQPLPLHAQPPSVSTEPTVDVTAAYQRVASPLATPARRLADVIISFAGKGGVGKSTVAFALPERAFVVGDIRKVMLVDANRGQGDARTYARIQGRLPSIYDAAISGKPEKAIVDPQQLQAARPGLPDLHIGVVLAPTSDQADPTIVTEEVYGRVIDYARSIADLVVIDTQIVEASDTSGLIDRLIIPLLRGGAWGLGLSDSSMPGIKNLLARLALFQHQGVTPDRMMVALNRVDADSGIKPDAIASLMAPYGTWMGSVVQSSALATAFAVGQIPGTSAPPTTRSAPPAPDAEFAAMLDRVLYRVTGLDAFAPKPHAEPPARKRFGLRRSR